MNQFKFINLSAEKSQEEITITMTNSDKDVVKITSNTAVAISNQSEQSIRDLVSFEISHTVQIIFLVAGCGVVSLFGIGANVINIAVFVRQGFRESINISLLGNQPNVVFLCWTCLLLSNRNNYYKLKTWRQIILMPCSTVKTFCRLPVHLSSVRIRWQVW